MGLFVYPRLNRMYGTGRLQQALGDVHADELLEAAETVKQRVKDAAGVAELQTEAAQSAAEIIRPDHAVPPLRIPDPPYEILRTGWSLIRCPLCGPESDSMPGKLFLDRSKDVTGITARTSEVSGEST
jgi:hypothetical protein